MAKVRGIGKVTDSHTTATDTAIDVIEFLAKRAEVTKISLGTITYIKGSDKRLKCLPITGGIKIVVRGSGAVQDLFVYTSDPSATKEAVGRLFT